MCKQSEGRYNTMITQKQRDHIQDRIANLRARLEGLKTYLKRELDGDYSNNMQLLEIQMSLTIIGGAIRATEDVTAATPQQRVTNYLLTRFLHLGANATQADHDAYNCS